MAAALAAGRDVVAAYMIGFELESVPDPIAARSQAESLASTITARVDALRDGAAALRPADVILGLKDLARESVKRNQMASAVRVTELMGKSIGMFQDARPSVVVTNTYSDIELARWIADRLLSATPKPKALTIIDLETEAAPTPG